jgi:branched-chain amino acid transport system permease protein
MMGVNLFQILNGLTFAALLFIVASGFTLIFGLLRIVNLAHGALYLFGGLVGYTVASRTGSFVLGALSAMAFVAALGSCSTRGSCASSAGSSSGRSC